MLGLRLVEIWANVPFLYMVIILVSVMPSWWGTGWQVSSLLLIMVLFSWTGMTYYIRAAVYKEKARDYVSAAKVIGASSAIIIFRHLLPKFSSISKFFQIFTDFSVFLVLCKKYFFAKRNISLPGNSFLRKISSAKRNTFRALLLQRNKNSKHLGCLDKNQNFNFL